MEDQPSRKKPFWFLEDETQGSRPGTSKYPRLSHDMEDATLPSFQFSQTTTIATPVTVSSVNDIYTDLHTNLSANGSARCHDNGTLLPLDFTQNDAIGQTDFSSINTNQDFYDWVRAQESSQHETLSSIDFVQRDVMTPYNVNTTMAMTQRQHLGNSENGDGNFCTDLASTMRPPSPASIERAALQNSSPDAVCFGMLYNIPCQLKWPPKNHCPVQHALSDRAYIMLETIRQEEKILLQTNQKHLVGCLSQKLAQVISNQMARGAFVDAWVPLQMWDNKVIEVQTNRDPRKTFKLDVNLNFCGPKHVGTMLAKQLGSLRLFLQEPLSNTISLPYENPQEITFDIEPVDVSKLRADFEEVLQSLGLVDNDTASVREEPASKNQIEGLLSNFEEIFARPPAHQIGGSVMAQGLSLLSPLHAHQHEGLEFMLQREAAMTTSIKDNILWNRVDHPEAGRIYQHKITGVNSKTPKDFAGGIIADDPGLGKTLVALTTVLSTLKQASAFGSGKNLSSLGKRGLNFQSKATLVIVPSEILLHVWEREIHKHLRPGIIRHVRYHSADRHEDDDKLSDQDIILTTYATVLAEHRRGSSPLFQTTWFRLVLDEAHTVRNSASKQFKAIQSLKASIRWCLTGTPIQNSLDDIGSLIQILGMPQFQEPAIFRKHVATVRIRKGSEQGEFRNLYLILSSICLRRTRSLLENGHTFETLEHHLEFSNDERQQYKDLEQECRLQLQRFSCEDCDETIQYRAMEALLRLRMFCNNGRDTRGLLPQRRISRPDEHVSILQQSGDAICCQCASDIHFLDIGGEKNSGSLTRCCCKLVCNICTSAVTNKCSLCGKCPEEPQEKDDYSTSSRKWYPSKIQSLVNDINKHSLRDKCIVFSFWKASLNLIECALSDHGIKFLRVDGDLPAKKRNIALQDFQLKQTWRVLLMTFSTGSTGLNGLTVANRVHLLEPQWNPAAEDQAIGRLLRLDQKQKVTVIRYAVKETVEEAIQQKQLRKVQLAGGGFSQPSKKGEKKEVRLQEIKVLQEYLTRKEENERILHT